MRLRPTVYHSRNNISPERENNNIDNHLPTTTFNMPIPRPKRSNRRYAGDEAVGTEGMANLSSRKGKSADGKYLRRRYAMAATGFMIIAGALAFSLSGTNGKDVSLGSGDGGVTLEDYLMIPETPDAPLDAYQLVSSERFDDLKASVAIYKHKKSGMDVVTMIPSDPYQDATFGINFRTPSLKNDGVQHVVKNAILAGSLNYPVKDPFNQMKRGSLQTFSDAWTERDRTSFVVASRNLADFRNNLKVTIDSVFNPLFMNEKYKWIYRQEGWRLESPDNVHLTING